MSPAIGVVADIRAQPGARESLRGQLETMMVESAAVEPGLRWWAVIDHGEDRLSVIECFVDQAAQDHHEARPEILAASEEMAPNIAGAEIRVGTATSSVEAR